MTNQTSSTDTATAPYRVVQWATGNVGSRALRRVIEHPELSLVGVYVHSGNKAGRDAGELCGIAPIGVKATNSIEDIIALRPDCVLYMPHETSYDEVCRLLETGANIVTTRGDFHHPASMDPVLRQRVEAACQRGASSIHSTGSSPGFVTEALPIVLTSIQRSLNRLSIYEFADVSSRDSPAMIFEIMGFGQKPGGSNQARHDYLGYSFGPSLRLIADALSLPLDSVKASGGVGLARHDTPIAAGVVPAGTVAAQRTTVSGMRGGQALITFTATWYVSSDIVTDDDEPWDFRPSPSGWRLLVDGDCPLDVFISFPVAPENYADMTPGLTAHRPVNTIPYICAAPPGIRTTVDLPQIIAKLV
jgi:4-hydroxy-tetrahydrodipicolinate reductase